MSFEHALALADPEDAVDALADVLWQRVDADWSALSSADQFEALLKDTMTRARAFAVAHRAEFHDDHVA